MNTRRNQNSVLFLATLGVYLGLVLTGATPVLVHAATTRQFDLRDELKFSDELDNKPDDNLASLAISVQNYLEDVESFIGTLGVLQRSGNLDLSSDAFEAAQTTVLPCVAANKIGSYTADSFSVSNESLRRPLQRFSKLLTDGYSLADCLPGSQFQEEATNSHFTFRLDTSNLEIKFEVTKRSPEAARQLAASLAQIFERSRSSEVSGARARLFENTLFRAENNQVFVITRLPRAALEPLLKNAAN